MDITIKYPSHNDLVQWYYQLAQSIAESAGVTPEQVNDLIEAYIAEHPYPVVPDDIITQANAAANVVTSVNGEKGDVTVTGGGEVPENVITTDNIAQNAVTSFNGTKGAVTGVTSVNGKNGAVTVSESPANVITSDNIAANAVTSFNGTKGDVVGVGYLNGLTGASINLATEREGVGYETNFGHGLHLITQQITMTYGVGGTQYYSGVLPKGKFNHIYLVLATTFVENPVPFTPSHTFIDTSEGVWTVMIGGLSSGTAPAVGTTKTVNVTMMAY